MNNSSQHRTTSGQEAMDIVLPDRCAVSEISFCLDYDDDEEEKKVASATHETITVPGSTKSALETSPESSLSV